MIFAHDRTVAHDGEPRDLVLDVCDVLLDVRKGRGLGRGFEQEDGDWMVALLELKEYLDYMLDAVPLCRMNREEISEVCKEHWAETKQRFDARYNGD